MKKFLKWLGIIVGALLAIAAISAFVIINKFNNRMDKNWDDVKAENISIPTDSASIANGRHFVPLCQSCHGEALEGKVFFEDPTIGTIYSPNLTKGAGGIGSSYTDKDWIRAIRHGINPKGKALFVMPSKSLRNLSEKDLAELIAHLKTIPAVDNTKGENKLPMFTKILMQLGAFGDVFSAEIVDHTAGFNEAPATAPTKEYGKYLVDVVECQTCHGKQLNGGKSPDPNSPPVPNITPAGNIAKWSPAEFISTMHTGVTPEKKTMNDEFMPWKHIGQLSDIDLTAILLYLKSQPAVETGPN